MGAGARDRLFGPSGVESAAAQVRRTDAVAAGHDRQVSHWQLPTLYQVSFDTKSSTWDTVRSYVTFSKQLEKEVALEPGPELLDTYWGVYFANATYRPISRIIMMTASSKDDSSVEKLTLGSVAKYTLASNATRDTSLLAMLKSAPEHHPKVVAILN